MRFCQLFIIFTIIFSYSMSPNKVEASGITMKKEFEHKTPYLTHSQLKEILHVTSDGSVLISLGSREGTLSGFKLISSNGKVKWEYKTKELLTHEYEFYRYGFLSNEAFYIMQSTGDIEIISLKDGKTKKKFKVTDKAALKLNPMLFDSTNTAYFVSDDYQTVISINVHTKEKKQFHGEAEFNRLLQQEKHFNLNEIVPEDAYPYLNAHTDDQENILPKDYSERSKKYNGYWSMSSASLFYESKILYYFQSDSIYSEKTGLYYGDATFFAFSKDGRKLFEVNKQGHAEDLIVENGISYIGTATINPKNIKDYQAFVKIIDKKGKIIFQTRVEDRIFSIDKVRDRIVLNLVNGKFVSYKIQFPKVMWGNSELKKGQIGQAIILSETELWKLDKEKKMTKVKTLNPGEQYRIYSYESSNGGMYGLGGGVFVKKSNSVKYETPSKRLIEKLDRF